MNLSNKKDITENDINEMNLILKNDKIKEKEIYDMNFRFKSKNDIKHNDNVINPITSNMNLYKYNSTTDSLSGLLTLLDTQVKQSKQI